ncbi:MAG: hypothetical protein ABIT37_14060, partial [Luteolibacter sp.]
AGESRNAQKGVEGLVGAQPVGVGEAAGTATTETMKATSVWAGGAGVGAGVGEGYQFADAPGEADALE